MRIGEVARRAGVNVETLRYYERRGLLDEPPRGINGHRVYDEETVRFGKGKDAPAALRRRFELELKGGVKLSEVYVTGYKDHFVKIRISHDPDDKAAADRIAALLEALGKSLK